MQAPPVQYTTTTDGVRIAYTVSGNGPPVVLLNEPCLSHVGLEWSQPLIGGMFERLAQRISFVRLDIRGTGLSDRVTTFDGDAVYGDVRAVVEHLGWNQYALLAVSGITPAAIIYASRHPDEVAHLLLVDPFLRLTDFILSPPVTAVLAAAGADWTTASEMIGSLIVGVGRAETRDFGAFVRSCVDPTFYPIALQNHDIVDATAAAGNVKAPTFIIRHAGNRFVTDETTRELAASIPGARLVTVPGLFADDSVIFVDRVLDWLLASL